MADSDFNDGCLYLEQNRLLNAETLWEKYLLNKEWQDGYLAFSAGEMRFKPDMHGQLQKWLTGRTGAKGERFGETLIEGFLMSGGLWRNKDDIFEELAFERSEGHFLVNYWRLDTKSDEKQCGFRPANVCLLPHSKIFDKKSMSAYEVKTYEGGHHLYIVRGAHE